MPRLLAFAALAAAGVAVAANLTSSRNSDFYSPGKHQFYVLVRQRQRSRVAYQDGLSADDAQNKALRLAEGRGKIDLLAHVGKARFRPSFYPHR